MFPAYPQHVFFRFLRQHIPVAGPGLVVDGPCGGGYITYHLSEQLPSKKIVGVDIDPGCVENAARYYHRDNLEFRAQDIHSFLESCGTIDFYLLVNSIFLLPRPEEIMIKIHNKLSDNGRLAVVIPNTTSANFNNFQHLNATQNTLILDKGEAISFFKRTGFRTELMKGLAFTTIYGNKFLHRLGRLRGLYTYAGDLVNGLAGKRSSYWGFILKKG